MNYKSWVSYGWSYGGTNATERANYFVSWGLMNTLPNYQLCRSSLMMMFAGV